MRVVWEEIECVFERPNEGVVRPFDRIFRLKVPGGWLVTRDHSLTGGTDIKHVISTQTEEAHQPADQFVRAFPIMVIGGITPGVVVRIDSFP